MPLLQRMILRTDEVQEIDYAGRLLRFDPIQHKYWLEGQELCSVTRYIGDAGYRHPFHGNGDAATFGRYTHEATALDDLGELDEETLDPQLKARLVAWRRFKAEEQFEPDLELIERPCFHPIYLYGGTPDRPGMRRGKPCVVEIKTGQKERWHALQVVAYRLMLEQHNPSFRNAECLLVYLNADGRFDLEVITDKLLPSLFLSIVACVNGKTIYGDA